MKTIDPEAQGMSCDSWTRYWADAMWRSLATMDLMRQRADNMLDHQAAGMPPLLHFEGKEIADARTFAPPCNYRLLQITSCPHHMERHVRRDGVPVIVVDPRAGHGPGIGGFKRDSEVGMAMLEGHPTYFVVFDPEPVEGQTMGAVVEALARFIDIVAVRHRNKPPIVYGNCQAGWAVALALSHCRREAALAVLNGSPLSYWAGEADVNPMRLAGGLLGGVWPAHLAADLGNGQFDGAWLVQNWENLRPEGVWKKYDQVFAQPDREHERFLEFERWWGGFYKLGREEILSIVRDLFIGNRVERGEVVVDGHCRANLAKLRTPLVIFCSKGDNITPPAQALGWLATVFGTTDALVRAGQRVVYMMHEHVGHLGIFVSADVAQHEHRAILHHAAAIRALSPGLYEMTLDAAADSDERAARASFAPRRIEDLPYEPRPAGFDKVNDLSIRLDDWYSQWISPIVRSLSNEVTAQWLQFSHPMRTSRLLWSSRFVPGTALLPLMSTALQSMGCADDQREDNPLYTIERGCSQSIASALESWRHLRDKNAEWTFKSLYEA
ncbi:MAG: DUF3141 domain-containing protein [Burkholderiaceae bacterium]|nr:DUF3141 domain-containing protein [Burkholderiaceae bacterium]